MAWRIAAFAALIFVAMPLWGFDNGKAIRVITAEAADQPLKAMAGVGEVIRRRNGNFSGFSVMQTDWRQFFRDQSPWARWKGRMAWWMSRYTYVSRGADHFDNVKRFGKPEWAENMRPSAKIGDLTFYRSH